MKNIGDLELIQLCLNNDRKAQKELYYRYYTHMMYVIKKYIQDPHKQEEVLNDGFMKIFQNLSKYTGTGSFEGWMLVAMKNVACSYLKNNKQHINNKSIIFVEKEGSTAPVNMLNYKDIIKLISKLPKATQKVVNLFNNGFTHLEIAADLGISIGTSKWHVNSAKQTLTLLIS